MKSSTAQEKLAGAAAWAYCVWQARDISHAWLDSPFDRAGGLAFLIWCVPALLSVWKGSGLRLRWFACGVVVSLVGSLGELNLIKYAGLAVVTAGFLPPTRASWIQLAGAVSWINLGWVLSSAGPAAVNALRVVIAFVTVLLVLRPPRFLR